MFHFTSNHMPVLCSKLSAGLMECERCIREVQPSYGIDGKQKWFRPPHGITNSMMQVAESLWLECARLFTWLPGCFAAPFVPECSWRCVRLHRVAWAFNCDSWLLCAIFNMALAFEISVFQAIVCYGFRCSSSFSSQLFWALHLILIHSAMRTTCILAPSRIG